MKRPLLRSAICVCFLLFSKQATAYIAHGLGLHCLYMYYGPCPSGTTLVHSDELGNGAISASGGNLVEGYVGGHASTNSSFPARTLKSNLELTATKGAIEGAATTVWNGLLYFTYSGNDPTWTLTFTTDYHARASNSSDDNNMMPHDISDVEMYVVDELDSSNYDFDEYRSFSVSETSGNEVSGQISTTFTYNASQPRAKVLLESWVATGLTVLDSDPLITYNHTFDASISIDVSEGVTYAVSPIPIPSVVWLFSSGLLGLLGISRRKKVA